MTRKYTQKSVGKDEVTSSNLVSSSKNPEFRKKFGIFHIQKLLVFEFDFLEKR